MPKVSFLKDSAGCPKILDYTLKPSHVLSFFINVYLLSHCLLVLFLSLHLFKFYSWITFCKFIYFLFTKYFVVFLANIGAFCFAASTPAQSAAFLKAEPKLENSSKNPFDCTILDSRAFDNFILADELFAKALWSLETCPPVTNNLCGQYQSHR